MQRKEKESVPIEIVILQKARKWKKLLNAYGSIPISIFIFFKKKSQEKDQNQTKRNGIGVILVHKMSRTINTAWFLLDMGIILKFEK